MTSVLLVDDEPLVRELCERWLHAADIHTIAAASCAEALALLANSGLTIDVIVVDLLMRNRCGRDFVARARLRRPGVAVMITGVAAEDSDTSSAGVDVVCAKPFDGARLVREVRRLSEAHRTRRDSLAPSWTDAWGAREITGAVRVEP